MTLHPARAASVVERMLTIAGDTHHPPGGVERLMRFPQEGNSVADQSIFRRRGYAFFEKMRQTNK